MVTGRLICQAVICEFVTEIISALISLGLIFLFRKTSVLRLKGKLFGKGLICGLPLIIIYSLLLILGLTNLPGKTLIPAAEIIIVIIRWFLIGIAEEGLFRVVSVVTNTWLLFMQGKVFAMEEKSLRLIVQGLISMSLLARNYSDNTGYRG